MLDLHSLRPKSQQATRRKQKKKKKSETSRKKGTLQRIIISEPCSEDNRIEIDITAGIFLSKTFFVTFNSLTKLNLIIHQPPWSTYSINPSYCLHDYSCRHSPRSYTEGKKKNKTPCPVLSGSRVSWESPESWIWTWWSGTVLVNPASAPSNAHAISIRQMVGTE